ncbi:hypothetical protein GQ53DRAFT_743149 [Thozetella sp. PMI_491]|nr:hypothetical protein GQ53DRAFT_743149 [Thozetella sp. PMI_491]
MAGTADNPSSRPPPTRFQFVAPEYEAGLVYAASRKAARSFAAKEGHARVRRKRVQEHQATKKQLLPAPDATSAVATRRAEPPLAPRPPNAHRLSWRPPAVSVVYPSFAADPFAAAARPVTLFEHGLLDHCKFNLHPFPSDNPSRFAPLAVAPSKVVPHCLIEIDIRVIVPGIGYANSPYSSLEEYANGTQREWIPLALTDPGMLDGIFITACRSLYALHGGGPYLEYALRYKLRCMASLQKSISEERDRPRGSSVAKAMLLAGDEVAIGEFLTSLQHVQAVVQMLALMGGPAGFGANKFLRAMLETFTRASAIEDAGNQLYTNYSYLRTSKGGSKGEESDRL